MAIIFAVERGDYSQRYVDVAFTSRGLAEAHAGHDGAVTELQLLDRAPVATTLYIWGGVLKDGRVLTPRNARAELGPPFEPYAEVNRFGNAWRSFDYATPELTSRVTPWRGRFDKGIHIEVTGSDRIAVKREFHRIVAQIKAVPVPASPS